MKLALAQINTTVGEIDGNRVRVAEAWRKAEASGADLVLFPELTLTGYPPQDLLLYDAFVARAEGVLAELAQEFAGARCAALVGTVSRSAVKAGRPLHNSAALLRGGKNELLYHKRLLPTYDVFDEDRYFEPGTESGLFEIAEQKVGITICEDIWNDEDFWQVRRYRVDPVKELTAAGATLIVNLSASPWHLGKERTRAAMLATAAVSDGVAVAQCNLVGGNDELVFDGHSSLFSATGEMLAWGNGFEEDFLLVDVPVTAPSVAASSLSHDAVVARVEAQLPAVCEEERLYRALVLGTRDYVRKCGFQRVVLGLSGGIDSSLVAVVAAEALGAENVTGLSLPARVSSEGSVKDAKALAQNLGMRWEKVGVEETFQAARAAMEPLFAGRPWDLTEENMQSRARGLMVMAFSNKTGALVLTTGNKSELAVGYCTIYGDMCGGLAVISDVPKTVIYRICRWINREREIIPEDCITKPPSAELRENQTDQDSLPPYEILDPIVERYVERNEPVATIIAAGFDAAVVRDITRKIDLTEYKRRQAAPGLKVTSRAFGSGRRMPIAQRWRDRG